MSEPMRCPVCGALRSGDGTCETCGPAADPASSDRPTDVVMQQEVPTHELPSAEPAGRVEREDAARFVGILVAERYRVMGIVGRGGFGLVLRAMDQRLGRLVALKLLDRVQGAPREEMARFEREARILASLDHPGIVPVYDVGVDDGRPYIAMKLVRGPSLARKLQGGPLPIAEAVKVMRDVSAALGHAHARGVLHRDVKPSNILVERDGRFILADFGISTAAFLPRITMRGTLEGTLDYLAPEVVAGQSSEQSDLYSLGAVLHEMLLGRPCFQASDLKELLGKIVNDPPPLLREPTVPLPSPLLDLLSRLLSKEPNARPASAAALGAEAARLLEPEAPGPAAADAADRPADLATELERVELAVEAFATLSTQRRPDEDAVLTRASEIEVRASALFLRLLAAPREQASRAFLVSLAHLADQVVNHLEDLSGRTALLPAPPCVSRRASSRRSRTCSPSRSRAPEKTSSRRRPRPRERHSSPTGSTASSPIAS
ncbi:MAG: serine/threonine-protein kinase [Acidobacteriota bacterium]